MCFSRKDLNTIMLIVLTLPETRDLYGVVGTCASVFDSRTMLLEVSEDNVNA
jgi:hypothetical protein